MNTSILKALLSAALSFATFAVLAANPAPSADTPDQVVASFDRMLHDRSTPVAATDKAAEKAEPDPLRAGVNAVLWDSPSYHLPVQYAFNARKQDRVK